MQSADRARHIEAPPAHSAMPGASVLHLVLFQLSEVSGQTGKWQIILSQEVAFRSFRAVPFWRREHFGGDREDSRWWFDVFLEVPFDRFLACTGAFGERGDPVFPGEPGGHPESELAARSDWFQWSHRPGSVLRM